MLITSVWVVGRRGALEYSLVAKNVGSISVSLRLPPPPLALSHLQGIVDYVYILFH